MDFSKIGISKGGIVEIDYDGGKNFADTIKRRCEDSPLPGFNSALQDFVEEAVEQCNLRSEDAVNGSITVRHVTLKWDDKKGEGVSITAEKLLENKKKFTVSTPLLYEDDKKAPLPKVCLMLVEKLKAEATKYVNGERLQGKLKI